MKKYLIFLIIFSTFLFSGCKRNKTLLLFNHSPITKETILDNSREFSIGEKIYYIFLTEKQLKTDRIIIRVMKMDEKANYMPTKLVYGKEFKMSKDEIYYYTDYLVFYDAGFYSLFVFTKEHDHPLANAAFKIKN